MTPLQIRHCSSVTLEVFGSPDLATGVMSLACVLDSNDRLHDVATGADESDSLILAISGHHEPAANT